MKVVISGGTGFIGLALGARLLRDGAEVHLLDIRQPDISDIEFNNLITQKTVQFLKIDLANERSLDVIDEDYTHFVHLAAILGVQNVCENPFETLDANVCLTLNFIKQAIKQRSQPRFIYASTSEVYAGTLASGRLSFPSPESSELLLPDLSEARSSYMLSKIYGEALCSQSGLPFTIFRPHNIYGPRMGMRHVIPELMRRAAHSETGSIKVYSPDHTRTFCFVDDAVEQIFSLMQKQNALGETFNVGNEMPEISMAELAKIIVKIVDKDLAIESAGYTPGSPNRRSPMMAKCKRVTKLSNKIDLYSGLQKTFDWYSERIFR